MLVGHFRHPHPRLHESKAATRSATTRPQRQLQMRKRLQELQRERASASLAAAVDDAAPVARACSRWLATLVLRPASSLMSMGPLRTDDYAVLLGHGSGNDSRAAAATGVRVSAATAQRRRGAEGKPRASQYSASSSLSMRTRHAVTCTCTRARSSGGRALLSGEKDQQRRRQKASTSRMRGSDVEQLQRLQQGRVARTTGCGCGRPAGAPEDRPLHIRIALPDITFHRSSYEHPHCSEGHQY